MKCYWPPSNPQAEDQFLPAVHCSVNTPAATIHIWRPRPQNGPSHDHSSSTQHENVYNCFIMFSFRSWGNSANIATDYRLDDWDSIPGKGKEFFFLATVSRPALRPTQSPIQWVPGSFPGGIVRPGSDTDHSPLCNGEIKKE
jgi:hypothetical protein